MTNEFNDPSDLFEEGQKLDIPEEQLEQLLEAVHQSAVESFELYRIVALGAERTKHVMKVIPQDGERFEKLMGFVNGLDAEERERIGHLASAALILSVVVDLQEDDHLQLIITINEENQIHFHAFTPKVTPAISNGILAHLVERGLEAHPMIRHVATQQTSALPEHVEVLGIGGGVKVALMEGGLYRVDVKKPEKAMAFSGQPKEGAMSDASKLEVDMADLCKSDDKNCDCAICSVRDTAQAMMEDTGKEITH